MFPGKSATIFVQAAINLCRSAVLSLAVDAVSQTSAMLPFLADLLSKTAAILAVAAAAIPRSPAKLLLSSAKLPEGLEDDSRQPAVIWQPTVALPGSPANVSQIQAAFP